VAGESDANARLDLFVARHLDLSRTQAATYIATGRVSVNGHAERASYRVGAADRVRVDIPPPTGRAVVGEAIDLAILYEDDALLVVDKPPGMVVHPAPGHWRGTLVNALVGRGGSLAGTVAGEAAPTERAGLVHRLDKDTSGLVIVAKTDRVHRLLTAAISARRIRRVYAALAWGHLQSDALTVDAPIARDPRDRKRMAIVNTGRSARTEFTRLARFDSTDLLRARLYTGRTHQIRVHLASVGHPVVGDEKYGGTKGRRESALSSRRHFLHAAWLTLDHPLTGEPLDLRSPLPADLRAVLAAAAGGETAIAAMAMAGRGTTGGRLSDGGDILEHVGFYQRRE